MGLGGFFRIIYEHLSGCFIPKNPSLRFSKLFQVTIVNTCGDIPRLVALVLGVSKLLAMAKDIGGLRPITMGRCFFDLLVAPLFYNFGGHFRSTYHPTNLKF
jgi:hypothetical protein